MSFLQRVGRAGRGRPGLILFVPHAHSGADFYFAEHPQMLVDTSKVENVAFNPNYPVLVKRHILALIFELAVPTKKSDLQQFFDIDLQPILDELTSEGRLACLAEGNYVVATGNKAGNPLKEIAMRGGEACQLGPNGEMKPDMIRAVVAPKTMVNMQNIPKHATGVVSIDHLQVLEELPKSQINRVFPGAIFKTQDSKTGQIMSFEVQQLDLDNGIAYMKPIQRNSPISYQNRSPMLKATVLRKENPIMPSRERWFCFGDNDKAALHITLSWAVIKEEILGYEFSMKKKTTGENLSAKVEKPQPKKYPQPLCREYEAPVLRFSFNEGAQL